MKEDLIKRLQLVKALADCGIGGEKENAQQLLIKLMKKNSITEADLEKEERVLTYFKYKTKLESRLLSQIIYMVMGDCDNFCQRSKGNNHELKKIGVKCNVTEKIEIIALYEFYNNAFQAELKLFYSAFISKNNIYPPKEKVKAESSPSTLTEEERFKIGMLMNGIDIYTLRKMIGNGKTVEA